MGLWVGSSSVKRVSVKGPVALMMPYDNMILCNSTNEIRRGRESAPCLCANFPGLVG